MKPPPTDELRDRAMTLYGTGKYDRDEARKVAEGQLERERAKREQANAEKPQPKAIQ